MQHRPDKNAYIGEQKPCGHRRPRHYRVRGAFDTPSEPTAAQCPREKNRTATPFESLCKYHAEAFSFSTRLRIRAAFSQERKTVKHLADGPYPELSERKPETCISTTLHPLRHLKGLSLFKGTQTPYRSYHTITRANSPQPAIPRHIQDSRQTAKKVCILRIFAARHFQ